MKQGWVLVRTFETHTSIAIENGVQLDHERAQDEMKKYQDAINERGINVKYSLAPITIYGEDAND